MIKHLKEEKPFIWVRKSKLQLFSPQLLYQSASTLCFLTLESRIEKSGPGWKKNPGSDFRDIFGLKTLKFFVADQDPGSGTFLTLIRDP
jgi:hypothetical protein